MINESIVKQRLLRNFYNSEYNNQVFGIQSQNIDAAAFSIFLRDNSYTYDQFINMNTNTKFFRTWGPRNTLHIYASHYYDLLLSFNSQYGNWFENKWKKKDIKLYEENITRAIKVCNEYNVINRKLLIDSGISNILVDHWGGIFIDLCQKGYILPCIEKGRTIYKCVSKFPTTHLENMWSLICYKYFEFFGPATTKDFAHWLSLDLNVAQNIIDNTPNIITYDNSFFDVHSSGIKEKDIFNDIIITSKFDNILLAYSDKSWIVEKKLFRKVWIKSGLVEAVIIYHNQVVGIWRYKKGNSIRVYIKLFYDLNENIKNLIKNKLYTLLHCFWKRNILICFVDEF